MAVYVGECLKPFCFGLFAYRYKWQDKKVCGYIFVLNRYKK